MKPRVLIVEDEPGIADTLQYALRTDGFEPAWAATGDEAVQQFKAQPPSLVILDVGLPDTSGFEVFKRLREHADVPVIFLTARSDEIDRVVGLELGADDYVAKPFSPRELVARVRSILRRSAKAAVAASPTVLPLAVDDGKRQIRFYGRLLELSRYEFGLLQTLVSRPGHVFSRNALLESVHEDFRDTTDRAIDSHIKNLRRKVGKVRPQGSAIVSVYGMGYRFDPDIEEPAV